MRSEPNAAPGAAEREQRRAGAPPAAVMIARSNPNPATST